MNDDSDLVQSLLAYDEDITVPAEHELHIRQGLGALLASAPTAKPASSPRTSHDAMAATNTGAGGLRQWIATGLIAAAAAGGGFVEGKATNPQAPLTAAAASIAIASPTPVAIAPASASEPAANTPAPAVSTVGPTTIAATSDAFDLEQSLLERARTALVRHDANGAEKALDEHGRHYPVSRHAEERDYLRIQVLRARGDAERVRERAAAFLVKYRDSLLRTRVELLAQ